jgi:hypothetical protein
MGRLKREGNHSPSKNKIVQDSEGNEETDTQIQTPKNKDKLCQITQGSPQEHSERRNSASNH